MDLSFAETTLAAQSIRRANADANGTLGSRQNGIHQGNCKDGVKEPPVGKKP
jgi:hypothetical protein